MALKPGNLAYALFDVLSSTGALTAADATPAGSVVRNGSADGTVTVTVSVVTTGTYAATFTIPAGYSAGDTVELHVAATVGGVATGSPAGRWVLDGYRLADVVGAGKPIPTAAYNTAGGLVIYGTNAGPLNVSNGSPADSAAAVAAYAQVATSNASIGSIVTGGTVVRANDANGAALSTAATQTTNGNRLLNISSGATVVNANLFNVRGQPVVASGTVTFAAGTVSTYSGADTPGTTALLATVGTAGAGLTSIPYTGPSVGAIQAGLLTAAAFGSAYVKLDPADATAQTVATALGGVGRPNTAGGLRALDTGT